MQRFAWVISVVATFSSCGGATTTPPSGAGGDGTGGTAGGGSATGGSSSTGGSTGTGGTSSGVACGKTTCNEGQICCSPSCGICGSKGGACPAIACNVDPVTPNDCNMVAMPPVLLSCMQQIGADAGASDAFRPVDLHAHGTVTHVTLGVPEGSCMEGLLRLQTNTPELATENTGLVVSDGDVNWDVEFLFPAKTVPNFMGAVVDVSYHYVFGGFGPTMKQLSVVSSGGPAVYVADGGDLDQLAGLPIKLSRGPAMCTTNEMCGSFARYGFNAVSPTGTTSIPPGGSAQIGDYLVVHGGYEEQTSSSTMCSDWFVSDVHVAMIKQK